MASIFKRGGKKNRHGKYIGQYFDEHSKRVVRSTGTSDLDAANQIVAKWERDVALRRQGVIDPAQERIAEHNQRHIQEHVAEYLAHCQHIGQSRVHVSSKRTQLKKLVEGINAVRLSDLDAHKVELYLSGLVKAGKSHRTHNQHRNTAVAFLEWCLEHTRIASNTLKIVPSLNEARDRRRVRRAMTPDELGRLVAVSEERRPYYLLAYYTGLRVKAVKAAIWADLDFTSASIRVRVGNAKGKHDDTFYNLHPKLMDELRRIRPANATPTDPVFKRVPNILTFHRDCKRAGVARYDAEGRQLDRHALRTTLGTHLALAGVLPQQAMRVLGHTDVRITMKHYTDLRLADTAKAVRLLPAVAVISETEKNMGASQQAKELRAANAQQLCGSDRQSLSATDSDREAMVDDDTKTSRNESPCKTNGFDAFGQPKTPTDLLVSADPDTIESSRAIGAVG